MPIVQARTGAMFNVNRGQRLRITDREGEQIADVFCVSRDDPRERYSAGCTIDCNEKVFLQTGDSLYSGRRHRMLTLGRDDVGKHDLLFGPCSPELYRDGYGLPGPHPNCLENLARSLSTSGITRDDIDTAFNVFQNTGISADGRLTVLTPLSKPGDSLELIADMNLSVAISACSALRANNATCGSLGVEILEADSGR